jgi:hypothetical protein
VERIDSEGADDTLPCRSAFGAQQIAAAKEILTNLGETSGELLDAVGIESADWPDVLRATVESMRGTASATAKIKKQFINAVLDYCKSVGAISDWGFIGTGGRQDYKVTLPDGTDVAIEAKGCPDGNNTTIWDRPSWADEFIVWSLCPESLQHNPGKGAWSGVGTRLAPKIVAEKKPVDAFIYWDGRCGTDARPCPKAYGVSGKLRPAATTLVGQPGREDWIPPPCIFLFPKTVPTVGTNPHPKPYTYKQVKFADALLTAFNVPEAKKAAYVHEVHIDTKGTKKGTALQVSVISRCWPDGKERDHEGQWKPLKRET